ncbi:MAG: cupin domain-containing protein [Planctomycetota bacterium]
MRLHLPEARRILAENPLPKDVPMSRHLVHDAAEETVYLLQVRSGVLPHYHKTHEELVYILEGEGVLRFGKNRYVLHAGSHLRIPAGTPHGYTNVGSTPTAVLSITRPRLDPADRHELSPGP